MLWMFKCRGIDSQNIVETLFVFLHFFFSNTEISSYKDIYKVLFMTINEIKVILYGCTIYW